MECGLTVQGDSKKYATTKLSKNVFNRIRFIRQSKETIEQ